MKFVIVIVSAAAASIVATLIAKSVGIDNTAIIGGGVGGAVGAVVGLKLFANKK